MVERLSIIELYKGTSLLLGVLVFSVTAGLVSAAACWLGL